MKSFIIHESRGLNETAPLRPPEKFRNIYVRFVHESVREQLLSGGLAKIGLSLKPNLLFESHTKMFEDCCAYLRRTVVDYKTPNTLGHIRRKSSDTTWDLRNVRVKYPLLGYASVHLFYHL